MADLMVVVGVAAFFGVAVLFIRACDWIIGPDSGAEIAGAVDAGAEVEEMTEAAR